MVGDGQDRAHARGWGEVVHPIRPKTIARYNIIPQKSYVCYKTRQHESGRTFGAGRNLSATPPLFLDISEYMCKLHILDRRLDRRRKEWLRWRRPTRLRSGWGRLPVN